MVRMARKRRIDRSAVSPVGMGSEKWLASCRRASARSSTLTSRAMRMSSVVSRFSMSMPNIRIHCDGSATPQAWPMPRPPKVPMVAVDRRRRSCAARQYEAMRATSAGSW